MVQKKQLFINTYWDTKHAMCAFSLITDEMSILKSVN